MIAFPRRPAGLPAGGPGRQPIKAGKMEVVVVDDLHEIAALAASQHPYAWEQLAENALEPNPFYEPWMLLPALKSLAANSAVKLVFVYVSNGERKVLCGLFPLELHDGYKGLGTRLPLKTLSLWKHKYCYLCTPLIHKDYAHQCLNAFFEWLAEGDHRAPLAEFGYVPGEGPFHQLLVECINERAAFSFTVEAFTRAMFRPNASAEAYLANALPGIKRKEFRRQENRLADKGRLEYAELKEADQLESWVEEFLALEAVSWKGQEGRALVSRPEDRAFFVEVAREAFRRDRLMMLALRVGGVPVAHKCNFIAGRGSFAFKIAYEDSYAKFSPGVLLEMDNIRRLHARADIDWMDSCANADNSMINRLWTDRLAIEYLLVGTGKAPGDLVVSGIGMLKWLNRRLIRRDIRPRRRTEH